MKRNRCAAGLVCVICSFLCAAAPPPRPTTQHVPREQWSGVIVNVKQEGDRWRIDGLNRYVTFLGADFSVMVQAGARCATHSDVAAVDVCRRCGKFLCGECVEDRRKAEAAQRWADDVLRAAGI